MKKYINKMILSAFCLVLASCSEDKLDEINFNKNNPTEMASKFILTDVMTSTAFDCVGSDLAFYASCYIEHNAGIYNQLYNAEMRSAEPEVSSTYNNQWNSLYSNLLRLKICREKCQDGGSENGNYYGLGIAQVLSAYNLALLTDLFGDVPWTEALQPGVIYSPKFDSQESLYKQIFEFLDSAIENFGKECEYKMGSQDLYFNDDIESWTKFAYGLKARYTMRLLFRSSDKNGDLRKVIEFADQSFKSAGEEAKFALYDGKSATSPFYQFYEDRNYLGASLSFYSLLEDEEDPRVDIYYTENVNGGYELAENGKVAQKQDFYAISGISTPTSPTFLLSYHEIEFLKAEAYARLGDVENAKTACVNGIVASCKKVNVNVADDDITEYTDKVSLKISSALSALKEVEIQKYIAAYEEEAIEAYNDIRRWKALGEANITLAHPQASKFPLRYTYGNEDVTTNVNAYNAFDNVDVYTDNVWWAGGKK